MKSRKITKALSRMESLAKTLGAKGWKRAAARLGKRARMARRLFEEVRG